MRITGLCADPGIRLDSVKGATVHLGELWCALAREGAEVTGIAPWGGGPLSLEEAPGLTLVPVPIDRDAPDVAERVLAAARAVSAARPDAVLERLSLDSDVGLELARALRVPLLVEVNAPLDEEATRFRGRAPTPEPRMRRLLEGADVVYVVSRALVDWAVARGAHAERVRVLPNGVDVAAFEGVRPAPGATTRVGFVGTFKAWHGLELVIDGFAGAVARGARLELDLVGDGPLRSPLEMDARSRGLAVRFPGPLPHAKIAPFLRSIDVAVAAAPAGLDYYFSPLKVYEYAAAGCAIVAPRAGQVAERFRDREDAWLTAPGDARAIEGALVALAGDPALRQRLGEAARARARAEFDWSVVARTILADVRAASVQTS